MNRKQSVKKLSKFLSYVLGHKPDEFGLVPDVNGFVKTGELLKALHEEEGWRTVRNSNINELLVTLEKPVIEIKENLIRAADRTNLPEYALTDNIPKLLFTCVRRKAYPFTLDKGISPSSFGRVILSVDKDLALKMGRRKDQAPVLLTVQAQKAVQQGIAFFQAVDSLYMADSIPPDCFIGPPLPKEKPETGKPAQPKEIKAPQTPGSYTIDLFYEKKEPWQSKQKGRKGEIAWKTERKRQKRKKRTPDFTGD